MNKRKILERAIELKECAEKFESVKFLDSDVEFFEHVVKELERTTQTTSAQEYYVTLKNDLEEKISNEKKVELLAEVILKEMTEKELPRIMLDKALKIIDIKFLNDATI